MAAKQWEKLDGNQYLYLNQGTGDAVPYSAQDSYITLAGIDRQESELGALCALATTNMEKEAATLICKQTYAATLYGAYSFPPVIDRLAKTGDRREMNYLWLDPDERGHHLAGLYQRGEEGDENILSATEIGLRYQAAMRALDKGWLPRAGEILARDSRSALDGEIHHAMEELMHEARHAGQNEMQQIMELSARDEKERVAGVRTHLDSALA